MAAAPEHLPRRTALTESFLLLGVSLGASALWSALALVRKLGAQGGLSGQVTAMNQSVTPDQPWLDLAHQLVGIALALVPVGLALHLLARQHERPTRLIGLDGRAPGRDVAMGLGLAAVIGIPGLGLYLAARSLGLNTTIAASDLSSAWWTVPVLVLAAGQNALLEEVVMVGYLFTRWREAGWSPVVVVVASALVRGSYHLYQGFGGFVGNIAMGLLLGVVYLRVRRTMPLFIAHWVIDVVAFVGYALLVTRIDWLGQL
ncbi:CPBP family intramembrane glutamic endopeptidase [Janibacter terrae]|uniref:CPBP family intramembrane glutamic endopeptidase n=1 Tax=Janibacter terrae TaxID=103817 RepID=UPI000837E4B0|nr:CPBP family intramembrane glutamic endopeptidase [Janibacter terrae]